MERIFLIRETSNNQIEQDLENTEDAIDCRNQAIITFFLQSMQHVILHYDGLVGLSILTVFHGIFQFINLIAIFSKIDGFTLRKELIIDLSNLTKWIKELFSGEIQTS